MASLIFPAVILLVVILLLSLLAWIGYIKRKQAAEIMGVSKSLVIKNQLARTLAGISLLFILAAYLIIPASQKPTKQSFLTADVQFRVDVSRSMGAERQFGSANRLERSSDIILSIAGDNPNLIVSICGFTMVLRCFLGFTQNHEDLKGTIKELITIGATPREGTNLTRALGETVNAFPDDSPSKLIVLLSDGEDRDMNFSQEELDAILEKARKSNVIIITVGVGEEEGAQIPLYANGAIIGVEGGERNPVVTRLREDLLIYMASSTGGIYAREYELQKIKQFIKDNSVERERDIVVKEKKYSNLLIIGALAALLVLVIKNW